jgi:hypothetical protein
MVGFQDRLAAARIAERSRMEREEALSVAQAIDRLNIATERFVDPTGDRATDTENLQAAIDAMAGVGEVLVRGHYLLEQVLIRSGVHIRGLGSREDTTFDFETDLGGELEDSCIFAIASNRLHTTTLAAVNVQGARTVSIASVANLTTTTAADFTQPARQATVSVTFASGTGITEGQRLFIQGGGAYSVVSLNGATAALRNINEPGNVAPGTIVSSGARAIGAIVELQSEAGAGFHGGRYLVRGISGTGPFTLTLDRAVAYALASGDACYVLDEFVHDYSIENLTVSGNSRGRLCELLGTRHGVLRNLRFRNYTTKSPDGSTCSDLAVSFDSWGYQNYGCDIEIDNGGADAGIGVENNEGTILERVTVRNITTALALPGIRVNNGTGCTIIDPVVSGCVYGVWAKAETVAPGPYRITIRGGDIQGCTVGIGLTSAVNARIENARVRNNVANIEADASNVTIIGGDFGADSPGAASDVHGSSFGLKAVNASRVHLAGTQAGGARAGIHVYDTSRVTGSGHQHLGYWGNSLAGLDGAIIAQDSATVDLSDVTLIPPSPAVAGYRAIALTGSATVRLRGAHIESPHTAWIVATVAGGFLSISHSTITGYTVGSNTQFSVSGGGVALGPGVNSSYVDCAVSGTGRLNHGAFVMGGGGTQAITVPTGMGLVSGHEDRIQLTLRSAAASAPHISITGAGAFTITGTSGDIIAWRVV